MKWFLIALRKYAVFDGRAHRREYWNYFLFMNIIAFLLAFFEGLFEGFTGLSTGFLPGGVLSFSFRIITLLPYIAVTIRRLHDINKSGWTILLGLIPIIGQIIFFIFLIQDGDQGENQYGLNPRENTILNVTQKYFEPLEISKTNILLPSHSVNTKTNNHGLNGIQDNESTKDYNQYVGKRKKEFINKEIIGEIKNEVKVSFCPKLYAFFLRAETIFGEVISTSTSSEWEEKIRIECSEPKAEVMLIDPEYWQPPQLSSNSQEEIRNLWPKINSAVNRYFINQKILDRSESNQISKNPCSIMISPLSGLVVFIFMIVNSKDEITYENEAIKNEMRSQPKEEYERDTIPPIFERSKKNLISYTVNLDDKDSYFSDVKKSKKIYPKI
ncbi:MAG: DUF805 domain-containing protein [Bacteroidales bacterium]|nr:DUF805 domain-containing protein [Bacteroidales bacterium]